MEGTERFEKGNGKRLTQYDRVLKHLKDYGTITDLEAYSEYGIRRLGAVIFNMRKDGYAIMTEYITKPNRYGDKTTFAKYVLIEIKEREI